MADEPANAAEIQMIATNFRFLDANQSGMLEKSEMRRVLQGLDNGFWSEERIDACIDAADANHDTKVQYEEFLRWVFGDGIDQDMMESALIQRGLPREIAGLSDGHKRQIRDALETLIGVKLKSVTNVNIMHKKIVQSLRSAEPPSWTAAEIITTGGKFPFVRFDKTSVPKEIEHGCSIYLYVAHAHKAFSSGNGPVTAIDGAPEVGTVFIIEKDGGDGGIRDGDAVLLSAGGQYLTADTDCQKPMTLAAKKEGQSQKFIIHKERCPTAVKHKDVFFLQTWLSNYVGYEDGKGVTARKWQRGDMEMIAVYKKEVMEAKTTELARKMQFQAFDLDGNDSVAKPEFEYMFKKIGCPDKLDATMAVLDPEKEGKVAYGLFKEWANGGALPKDTLHHAEVIGNTAQRCSDCLDVEKTLIECLTIIPSTEIFEIIDSYAALFGGENLAQAIDKKVTERKFSTAKKLSLRTLIEPDVDLWTHALNDAVNGLGNDENTLTALVCTIPDRLRSDIFKQYQGKYGTSLFHHIKSATKSSYKKVLELQAMFPAECRARLLNQAMDGLGTDEDQLIRVVCQCDFGERRAIKEAYQRLYNRDLIDHIKSETSGHLQKGLVLMLNAEETEFNIDQDCEKMKGAMDGFGTNEDVLVELICSKTPRQMIDINKAFKEKYNSDLFDRVRGETSGHLQTILLGTINHPMDQLAENVRECLKGWSTDVSGLMCMLVHLPEFKKRALLERYNALYARDLIADIKSGTSGSYEGALCALVKPAARVWAEALTGALKGVGTKDELIINFLAIAKDYMGEVRKYFKEQNAKTLVEWIGADWKVDYQDTLVALASRDTEFKNEMAPIFWAQRLKDALTHTETITDILCALPAVAIKRGTYVFLEVYGKPLEDALTAHHAVEAQYKTGADFANMWLLTAQALMTLPVRTYVTAINVAMTRKDVDEFSLTGLICAMPENLHKDIDSLYREDYGMSIVAHMEKATATAYKELIILQTLSWPQSRARALRVAMDRSAESEALQEQLIYVVISANIRERKRIREAYSELYEGADLIADIESRLTGAAAIFVAVLESDQKREQFDYEEDCHLINDALETRLDDMDHVIRIFAGKQPHQLQYLEEKFAEMWGAPPLVDRIAEEGKDWGDSIFGNKNFRNAVLGLLRGPEKQLVYSVRDCLKGFKDDPHGLITCLVHLSERKRNKLIKDYKEIPGGGDLFEAIKVGSSGDFEHGLLALFKPAPILMAEAIERTLKGFGQEGQMRPLLVTWMCVAKDRMEDVRKEYQRLFGVHLADAIRAQPWAKGDFGDALVRLANRECMWYVGVEAGVTMPPPPDRKEVIKKFNITFNELCAKKKANPDVELQVPEESQQELGCAFMYYANYAWCRPNMDKGMLWDMTNAIGFPPADKERDLDLTFDQWNYSGSEEITWNDFVREMKTRVNDRVHYLANPLPVED